MYIFLFEQVPQTLSVP